VIGSVTRPFCGACDRVRLTADGQIRNCLFARDESDLRTPLRAGADDDQGNGDIGHDGGIVTGAPGLYVLGMPVLLTRAST
jgi:Molybdenum Cofactor Synthesis C